MGRDPFPFCEKLLNLLDEGAFTATYKYAALLGLVDLCMELSASDGAEKFVEHTEPGCVAPPLLRSCFH